MSPTPNTGNTNDTNGSDGSTADNNTTDNTTDSDSTTDTTQQEQQKATTQNDPEKNRKLAEVTMVESLRDLMSFNFTLPGIYKGMHTNQFLWLDLADDFYDDFYGEIMDIIGEHKLNRYSGFKENRFYIQKKTWTYNLKDGVTTELEVNPFPSPYSEYIKYQLEAEKALDQAVIDATGGGGGGLAVTDSGAPLGNDALEVGKALASKYHFCSGNAQTYEAMKKSGCGSCWAWSDALYTELRKIGVACRIIQYATSSSSNHRSVQVKNNGAWVDYPYREVGIDVGARATKNKPGMFVYKDENGNGGNSNK